MADLADQAWQAREPRSAELPGAGRAAVALPLTHNGVSIGALALARRSRGPALFSAAGWSLLMVFGNVAAAALVNVRLVAQLQRRAHDLQEQVRERTAELEQSRDLLRIIFDQLPDGLVLLDDQQRVLMANQAFCASVLGRAPAQVLGLRYPALVADLRQRQAFRREPAAAGRPSWRASLRAGQGRARWYAVDRYAARTRAGAGTIERWRDVTREQELHQRLLQHEQLASMARLAASVVHEVGNPLQSVRSCLDLCREDRALADGTAEYLALADSELERMSGILNRLRDLYRPPQLVWELVDLNKLAVAVRHLTARQLASHGVELQIELAPELPPVRAQADPLRQVLLNLLLNAQQAMPSGGTIAISTLAGQGEPGCSLRVSDTGAGIAPERLAQIFDPFASSKPQGLGLGLYISRQVVEQHGGSITIASTLGAGTTVTVWLPYREEISDGAETYATAG
jgi:PAS domain S-box-containing protein